MVARTMCVLNCLPNQRLFAVARFEKLILRTEQVISLSLMSYDYLFLSSADQTKSFHEEDY
jgi:hypothetical protein